MATANPITMPASQKDLTLCAVLSGQPPAETVCALSLPTLRNDIDLSGSDTCIPPVMHESTISAAFAAFLPILATYIRAERELEDVGFSLDPAYSEWHRESDEAQDRLIDMLYILRSAPIGVSMDVPLRRMALLIHAMRCEPDQARTLHRNMDAAFETRFRVPGSGAMAQHRTLMLSWCRPLVADLVSLPLFDSDPEAEDDLGTVPSI